MLCTYLCAPCLPCAKINQGMVCLTAGSPLTSLATGISNSGRTYTSSPLYQILINKDQYNLIRP